MKDIIYIKDLRVKTIIGIFDWERKVKQEVSIDLEFPFDCKKAAAFLQSNGNSKSMLTSCLTFLSQSNIPMIVFTRRSFM